MKLSKNKGVYLYGDNAFSRKHYLKLEDSGYSVFGIIDSRYDLDVKKDGFCFCSLKGFSKSVSDAPIIVCLNDGMKHGTVSDDLYALGFKYILILPMNTSWPQSIQSVYRKSFLHFENDEFEEVDLPEYRIDTLYDSNVISVDNDKVSFWCGKDDLIVFNEDDRDAYNESEVGETLSKYVGCCVEDFYPYRDLFDYLGGNNQKDISVYLKMQRSTDPERDKLIKNRKELYDVYEKNYIYNMSLFTDAPCTVIWDGSRNKFYVTDGLHRIYYLRSKGLVKFPVIATEDDYRSYISSISD